MPDPVLEGSNRAIIRPSTKSLALLKWCNLCSRAMRSDWIWDMCSHCHPRFGTIQPPHLLGRVTRPVTPSTKPGNVTDTANLLFCVHCIEINGPTNQNGLEMTPFIIPSQENYLEIEDAKKILPPIIIPSQENHLKKEEMMKLMPHFNANGEFIKCRSVHSEQQSPVYTAPPASVSSNAHIPPAAVRLCRRWRHGCAGIIMADASATACSRCLVEGHPLYASDSSPNMSSPPKQPPFKLDLSERPQTRQVKKKDFAYMNSTQSRAGHQILSGAGHIVPSTQPFNVTTAESFNTFRENNKQSTFVSFSAPKRRPHKPAKPSQLSPWQVVDPASTPHLHGTVVPKLRVSPEVVNLGQHRLASNTASMDITEDSPIPATKESTKAPLFIRIKRKLPSEEVIQSRTEKRRRLESLGSVQAQGDVKEAGKLTGWDSDLTEFSSSDQAGSDTETEQRVLSGMKIRIPSLTSRQASSSTNPSLQIGTPRTCTIKACKSTLPHPEEYKYKMCKRCRVYLRDYQRSRVLKNQSLPTDKSLSSTVSITPDNSESASPLKKNSHHKQAKHIYRLPLRMFAHTPTYQEYQQLTPLVESFATRLRDFMDAFVLWQHLAGKAGASTIAVCDKSNDRRSSVSRDMEVSEDSVDLGQPVQPGQDKPIVEEKTEKMEADKRPVSFTFEGEYSIIATKELVPGPKGTEEIWQRTGRIVEELERVSGLQFQSTSSFGVQSGGMIMRFGCLHNIDVPIVSVHSRIRGSAVENKPESDSKALDPTGIPRLDGADTNEGTPRPNISPTGETFLASAPSHMQQAVSKTVIGELEVAAMPDRSHRFFTGQRTIIRFRLVG